MESEVPPPVLKVLNDRYLEAGSPGVTKVVRDLGVYVPPVKMAPEQFEYAWRPAVGMPIVTFWAEDVRVHSSGRWFYVDTLDTALRRGGGIRTEVQQRRARNRIAILRRMRKPNDEFIGLLQTNVVSIEDLERNENAQVSKRVKDEERWHIAEWDEERQRIILVRGDHKWTPSLADIEARTAAAPQDEVPVTADPKQQPRVVFPDQPHRDAVEAASVAYVRRRYEDRGYMVEDVSSRNLGYDLEVFEPSGKPFEQVEVKGTSTPTQAFFITANEFHCAMSLPTWRLAIVTCALAAPAMEDPLTAEQMVDRFGFDALVWRCTPKVRGELSEEDRAA